MIYEFKLPDIGEGVVEGEVVRWLVAEGDVVREDQPLVEIMTDKATVEIPAPRAGRIARRWYAEGQGPHHHRARRRPGGPGWGADLAARSGDLLALRGGRDRRIAGGGERAARGVRHR